MTELSTRARGLYIHLDLDGIDADEVPGVGYRTPDGVAGEYVARIIRLAGKHFRLRAAPSAAYDRERNRDNATRNLAVRLAEVFARAALYGAWICPGPKGVAMVTGFFGQLHAHRRGILTTIVTIFLLERVRRGFNRIGRRLGEAHVAPVRVERAQQSFLYRAALLYGLPFVLPVVKYLYRSAAELTAYVDAPEAFGGAWVLIAVCVAVELFLSVIAYNLLGIYVERVNRAVVPIERVGRTVVGTSRGVVRAGETARRRAVGGMRRALFASLRVGSEALSRGQRVSSDLAKSAFDQAGVAGARLGRKGGEVRSTLRGMGSRAG